MGSLVNEVDPLLHALGGRIALARRRRQWRQEDLALRANCSRSTVQAIERGAKNVAVGHVVAVLWVLGLEDGLELIANPALDKRALTVDVTQASIRVRPKTRVENDF